MSTCKKTILSVIIIVICLLFPERSIGERKILLTDNNDKYNVWVNLSYLWEEERPYDIEQITSSGIQSMFRNGTKETNNFGLSRNGIWLKVKLKNLIPEKQSDWVLEAAYPHYDTIRLFYQNTSEIWESYLAGDHFKFSDRKIYNKNFAYPISLPDTITRTFYFRIVTEGSTPFPFSISSREKYHKDQEIIGIIYGGCFFGIIFIMLLYNLFIYFSLKDRLYLLYVLTISCVLVSYLSITGYGFQYFWGNYPWLNMTIAPLSVFTTGLISSFFFRSFLDTRKFAPILDKIFIGFMILYLLEIVSMGFLSYTTSIRLAAASTVTLSSFALYAGYYVWARGNKSARFMAIAFTFYFLGLILYALSVEGLLNTNFIVQYGKEIGTVFELTLLSLALSDKYKIIKEEKEKAQQELIEMHKKNNEKLEKMVEERTVQVNLQNEKLKGLNQAKDRLLSIISHDLKGPLNAFQALLSMMTKDDLTPEKTDEYIRHLNNKLTGIMGLVDNILSWVRSQMEGIKLEIVKVPLKSLVQDSINVSCNQAELKEISIVEDIPDDLYIKSDKNVIRLIVRNLLNNSIKFTENGGNIYITAEISGEIVTINVRDTGVGMSEEKVGQLFTEHHFSTEDTNQKAGTGLGLILCKEFLSKTSGTIWAESEPGNGSTFKFTQPLYKE